MGYYKLIQNDIIVGLTENPVWVKRGVRGGIVRCNVSDATGVMADNDDIYQITGASFLGDGFEEVVVGDITKEEYDELRTMLGLGAIVSNNDGCVNWHNDTPESEEACEDATLSEVKARKLELLSDECRNTIFQGEDVVLTDGSVQHFTFTLEDQLNLITLSSLIENGESKIPYHASGSLCAYYSAEDFLCIVDAANTCKTYHTAYYNSLKNWVMAMDGIAEVGSVKYGDTIPDEYCSEVFLHLRAD